MSIATGDAVDKFGTTDTVVSSGASVADAAWSAASSAWTNDDDAREAGFTLVFQKPSGTVSGHVFLHYRRLDINGTTDESVPDNDFQSNLLGVFLIDQSMASTTNVAHGLRVPLPNLESSQQYEFYINNESGVTMTAGWSLTVTPLAAGKAA